MLQSSQHVRNSQRTSIAATVIVGASLLLIAWGTFAFGAVYAWAYIPLAVGCALVGLLGLTTGSRPVWVPDRWVLLPLLGIALVGLVQLVPLPRSALTAVSPGTVAFLSQFDLRFSVGVDPATDVPIDIRHAISLAPNLTVRALALLGALGLFLIGLSRSLSRTAAGRLARGIVVIGCVLATVGIVQKAVLGDGAFSGMRIYGFWQPENLLSTPFGPYVNKNHFAGWMLMAIPLALAFATARIDGARHRLQHGGFRAVLVWLSEPDGGRMLLYLVAALLMALSLLMTGSRSGLGCFALVMVGGAWLAARRLGLGSRRSRVLLVSAALLLLLVALQWAGRDAALQRFLSDPESVGLRLSIWAASLEAVRHFPLLGTGLDTFGTAMLVYQPANTPMHYNEAHNEYVQLLVEGGVLTFALLIVAIVSAMRAVSARFRGNDDGLDAYWVRAGASTGLVAIALQSLVEFSLQMPGNAVLFVVLLATALYVPAPHRQPGRGTSR